MSKFGECLTTIVISNRKGNQLCNRILVVSASDNVANRLRSGPLHHPSQDVAFLGVQSLGVRLPRPKPALLASVGEFHFT
jgi:hypothetical protein